VKFSLHRLGSLVRSLSSPPYPLSRSYNHHVPLFRETESRCSQEWCRDHNRDFDRRDLCRRFDCKLACRSYTLVRANRSYPIIRCYQGSELKNKITSTLLLSSGKFRYCYLREVSRKNQDYSAMLNITHPSRVAQRSSHFAFYVQRTTSAYTKCFKLMFQ
jgi:hypothetical protein